ncbi:transposase family protein [Sulfurospirillum diekertiae]|uniref:DDE Tnp4 domain-containing protein n=1 Tax=Sulfurospirillum diekertiae TaxID=1854492 RepID=A0AA92FG48_9BACT|nr:hypothetical protein FA584_05125 [Sulfurospirillum diekertiae]
MSKTQKKQREYYSGKQKRHTLKGQIVIDKEERIMCVHTAKGTTHDFRLFQESNLPLMPKTCVYVDLGISGYCQRT